MTGHTVATTRDAKPSTLSAAKRNASCCATADLVALTGDYVAGDPAAQGFQPIGDGDATANLVCGKEGANVKVGKLDDPKALKPFGQACERNARAGDFHVEPLVKEPVGRGHKRQGAYRDGGLLDEPAAGGRGRVESYGTGHGSVGVAWRSHARFAISPSCDAPCPV